MSLVELTGWSAAGFCTILLVPQIIKAFRTRHTRDLSMLMLVFSTLGNGSWSWHGFLTDNIPLFLSATLIMLMSLILIIYKFYLEGPRAWT